jgi:hypothetical protein
MENIARKLNRKENQLKREEHWKIQLSSPKVIAMFDQLLLQKNHF